MTSSSPLHQVVGASKASSTSSTSSDWSGVAKLAALTVVGLGGYFVWRQFVVVSSTARGFFGSASS